MKYLLYLYLFILPFGPFLSKILFLGYPLMTWIMLLLFLLSFISALTTIQKKRFNNLLLLLIVSYFITFVISVLQGWAITKIITNSAMYYFPFFVCVFSEKYKVKSREIIKTAMLGVTIASIFTILIAVGVLSSGIHAGVAATDNAKVNYNYVDTSSGVFSLLLGIYLFASEEKHKNIKAIYCCFCGLLIIVFDQSRGYFLTTFLSCLIFILLTFILSKQKRNKIKVLGSIMFIIVLFIVILNTSDTVSLYFNQLMDRISGTTSSEVNITYRFSEINEYFSMFLKNPLFGKGWGLINNSTSVSLYTERYRAHNMFIGILACTGLMYTPLFIYIILKMLFMNFKKACKGSNPVFSFSTCCIISSILLGVANAGFNSAFSFIFILLPFCLYKEHSIINKT